jgi:4-amino-4-deoxy-L-arabinose transferase-like glycosyltransferase
MTDAGLQRWMKIAIAALVLFACLVNISRPLANPDEGRYSEIAREMAVSGDWVTPRLNGVPYFFKPPLQYWATAVSFKVFGFNEFAARLYVLLCGLLSLFMVGVAARRLLSPEAGWVAASMLAASPYFLAFCGIVTLDTGLMAWTTVAVCAFLIAQADGTADTARRRWMLLAWAGMALAILSKGLIGIVFPAAAIFLYCVLRRDFSLLARLEWLRGGALFFAMTVPWHVLAAHANADFVRFYFVHEHFERFLTKVHRREEPWWYFWPILFGGFLPWAAALVPAAFTHWRSPSDRFQWTQFAILWTLFITLFFSASRSKLPAYLLPVYPVFALVLATWWMAARPAYLVRFMAPVGGVILLCLPLVWGIPDRAKSEWLKAMYSAARPWIFGGALAAATGLLLGAWLTHKGRKPAALVAIVAGMALFIAGFAKGYGELSPRQSARDLAAQLKPLITPDTRIFAVRTYDQSLPFYLQRTLRLVDYIDEFEHGVKLEPKLLVPTLEAFAQEWNAPSKAIALIHPDTLDALQALQLPMKTLHRDDRRIIVAKP